MTLLAALGVVALVLVGVGALAALVELRATRRRRPADEPARPLGALVVDEVAVPIRSLRLRGGELLVDAHLRGPAAPVEARAYTLHGDDGQVVYRSTSANDGTIRWPRLHPGDSLAVTVRVRVDGRESLGWFPDVGTDRRAD